MTIIGAGRVGKALARCMHQQGLATIIDVVCRSDASALAAANFVGAGMPRCNMIDLADAEIFLLAVPDDQIARCCELLATTGKLGPNRVVLHCSGALPASLLGAAVMAGAHVASVHPMRSFADPMQVADHFAGTHCGVEGDPQALAFLSPLLAAMGAILVPLQSESKSLYHAAAVFASNYVVSLMAVAQEAAVASGIAPDMALQLLVPLARESIENVLRLGPPAALTGPIARGDTETVVRQQQAVGTWNAQAGMLYAALVDATRRLAARRDIDNKDLDGSKK